MTSDPVDTPALSVRPRVPADLDDCVGVLALTHAHSRYPVNWPAAPAAWLNPPTLLAAWVAEADGRIVGHVALCRGEDGDPAPALWAARGSGVPAVCVNRLFVAPKARGLGAGAALTGRAVGEARSLGGHPVLDVVATDPAAAFYARLGWQDLGRVDQRWGPDQVVPLRCYAAPVSGKRTG
ncbi:GNAT family N-acetyltransferase [Streptomyces sp. NPDC006259]|uniref:GNAT family N-acetyltransferase n=1 Tax=Streptomyces sp. NPDC006259 TaxID=3364740 RepID=UPI0036CE5718